jgi:hypothetical protein
MWTKWPTPLSMERPNISPQLCQWFHDILLKTNWSKATIVNQQNCHQLIIWRSMGRQVDKCQSAKGFSTKRPGAPLPNQLMGRAIISFCCLSFISNEFVNCTCLGSYSQHLLYSNLQMGSNKLECLSLKSISSLL